MVVVDFCLFQLGKPRPHAPHAAAGLPLRLARLETLDSLLSARLEPQSTV